MFLIPGFLIALITFPGVIVHEIAHRIFCDLTKTPVYKVCYFRLGNPGGYVTHGRVEGLFANFLISMGPLIVNSILCGVLMMPLYLTIQLDSMPTGLDSLLAWVGLSVGIHAIPSNADMANLTKSTEERPLTRWLIAGPLAMVVYLANFLRIFWFDAIYVWMVTVFAARIAINIFAIG